MKHGLFPKLPSATRQSLLRERGSFTKTTCFDALLRDSRLCVPASRQVCLYRMQPSLKDQRRAAPATSILNSVWRCLSRASLKKVRPLDSQALSRIHPLSAWISAFRKQLSPLRSQVLSFRKHLSRFREQVSLLRSNLPRFRSNLSRLRSELSLFRERLSRLRSEVSRLRSKVLLLRERLSQLRS